MKPSLNAIPDCVIFLLAKAYQKAHGVFKTRLNAYGLTNLQHLVLEGLWYRGGMTAAELGKLLVLDKATLSGVLDRMVEAGWIEKEQDQDDRRVYRLYPAARAMELKEQLIAERQECNAELLAGLSPEEQAQFKQMLWQFL